MGEISDELYEAALAKGRERFGNRDFTYNEIASLLGEAGLERAAVNGISLAKEHKFGAQTPDTVQAGVVQARKYIFGEDGKSGIAGKVTSSRNAADTVKALEEAEEFSRRCEHFVTSQLLANYASAVRNYLTVFDSNFRDADYSRSRHS